MNLGDKSTSSSKDFRSTCLIDFLGKPSFLHIPLCHIAPHRTMSSKPQERKRSAPSAGSDYKKAKYSNNGKPSYGKDSKPFKGKPQPNSNPSYASRPARPNGNQNGNSKGKAKEEYDEPAKRRKQPITMDGGEVVDGVSDEEGDIDMDNNEEDEEVGYADTNKVVVNEANQGEKRGRMSKEERAALHAAQPHRTTLLPSHGLLVSLLPLWERARKVEMPKEERKAAIADLWGAVKGRVGEISKGHKGGRILQTVSRGCD